MLKVEEFIVYILKLAMFAQKENDRGDPRSLVLSIAI